MTFVRNALLLLCLSACPACGGTDVGNPTISFDAALVREGSGRSVTEAWIQIDRVRLRPASNCDGSAELDLTGPFAVDLLLSGTLSALRSLSVADTRYCRFELRWAPSDAGGDGEPTELAGASVLVAGERGDGTPFVLRSERNDELRLDAVNGSFGIDSVTTGLFLGLDASELFANVPLDDAETDDEGQIRIEPGSNEDLLEAFEDALEGTARLFRDADRDGDLADDEADPSRALAE